MTVVVWRAASFVLIAGIFAGCSVFDQGSTQVPPGVGAPGGLMGPKDLGDTNSVPPTIEPLVVHGAPGDRIIEVGQNVTFSVTVEEQGSLTNLTYQWMLQCEPIPGATNSTLTITSVSTNDVGFYVCYVFDGFRFGANSPMQLVSFTEGASGPITLNAKPVPGSAVVSTCPGSYSGYIRIPVRLKALSTSLSAQTSWSSAISWMAVPPSGGSGGGSGCTSGSSLSLTGTVGNWYGFVGYFPPSSPPNPNANYSITVNTFRVY